MTKCRLTIQNRRIIALEPGGSAVQFGAWGRDFRAVGIIVGGAVCSCIVRVSRKRQQEVSQRNVFAEKPRVRRR